MVNRCCSQSRNLHLITTPFNKLCYKIDLMPYIKLLEELNNFE